MALTVVYVDATLASGANNGTSWANAYQGCAGLQTAIDNVAALSETEIRMRNTFSVGTYGSRIDIDGNCKGDNVNGEWVTFIGYDDSDVELLDGEYCQLDGESVGFDVVYLLTVEALRFKHIDFHDAGSGRSGIRLSATGTMYNFLFEACRFSDNWAYGAYGASTNPRDYIFIDCVFEGNGWHPLYVLNNSARSVVLIGCYLEITAGMKGIYTGALDVNDCIFVGGAIAIENYYSGVMKVRNSVFYNQTEAVYNFVYIPGKMILYHYNNIYLLADAANDYVVIRTYGQTVDDYCITNCSNANGNLSGANSQSSLSVAQIGLRDPDNGDFRLNNTSLGWRASMPTLGAVV